MGFRFLILSLIAKRKVAFEKRRATIVSETQGGKIAVKASNERTKQEVG